MPGRNLWKLVVAVAVVELIGNLGAIFTLPAISTWYASLAKPSFTPPSWLFGPAWIVLYALIGIALYLVWERGAGKPKFRNAMLAFGAQLVLNVMWSFAFFGLHSPAYGVIVIVALWIAILAAVITFYRISRAAAYALVPYLIWVTFAAILNMFVFLMNP